MRREERRRQLLDVAIRIFARRGLGSGRHAEIAAEADVAVPTVFSYFPTRALLVDAVLGEVDRFLVELVDEVADRHDSASDAFLGILRAFAQRVDTHPDHIKVWLNWSTAIREEVWPRYEDFQHRVIARFAAIVRAGQARGEVDTAVDPETAAYLIMGSGQMIAQMKFTQRDPASVERYLETLIHGALH